MKKNKLLVAKKAGLTVGEIQKLQPLAEIYELNKYRNYIVVIKKSSIIGIDQTRTKRTAVEVARVLQAAGIKCQMIVGVDDTVEFLELK